MICKKQTNYANIQLLSFEQKTENYSDFEIILIYKIFQFKIITVLKIVYCNFHVTFTRQSRKNPLNILCTILFSLRNEAKTNYLFYYYI